jgi:hypothetical protein
MSGLVLPGQERLNGHDAQVQQALNADMIAQQRVAQVQQFLWQTASAVYAALIAKHVDVYGAPDIQNVRNLANCAKILAAYLPEAFGLMKVQTEPGPAGG